MLKPEYTGKFKKDYKLAVKRGLKPKLLEDVITLLITEKPLPKNIDVKKSPSQLYWHPPLRKQIY